MHTPVTWSHYEVGPGDTALLGFTSSSMHLIAPPAAQSRPDESDSQRARWRHLVWFLGDAPDESPVTSDDPDSVAVLTTADVLLLLADEHQGFVKRSMARQLGRAALYGSGPEAGTCLPDRYARPAGRTVAWVGSELSDAFPGERWFTTPTVPFSIPGTIEELLLQLPPAPSAVSREERRRAVAPAACAAESRRPAPLPNRFQAEHEGSRRRPGIVVKVVKFVAQLPVVRPDGRLAYGFERLSNRLEASAARSTHGR